MAVARCCVDRTCGQAEGQAAAQAAAFWPGRRRPPGGLAERPGSPPPRSRCFCTLAKPPSKPASGGARVSRTLHTHDAPPFGACFRVALLGALSLLSLAHSQLLRSGPEPSRPAPSPPTSRAPSRGALAQRLQPGQARKARSHGPGGRSSGGACGRRRCSGFRDGWRRERCLAGPMGPCPARR